MEVHRRSARHLYSMAFVALRRSFYSSQTALCQQPKAPMRPQSERIASIAGNTASTTSFPTRKTPKMDIESSTGANTQNPENQRLDRTFVSRVLDKFVRSPVIVQKAAEHYLAGVLYKKAFQKFRTHCLTSNAANVTDLADVLSSIESKKLHEEGNLESLEALFPYFLKHCQQEFAFLNHIDELRQISDMSQPYLWYPEARAIERKIIFHAGPTNSGKTYEALEVFKKSNSGMYCAPLRLLAAEIFRKMNQSGISCDLVTGEDRRFGIDRTKPAAHLAITVEMMATDHLIDIAVIDEIQMIRDNSRGYAFTRALLGIAAPEVHLCGEEAAVEVVQKLLQPTEDSLEVRRYERKSSLVVSTHGLNGLENIQDGDCIVVFSKDVIISYAAKLKAEFGRESAIIYGDLPAPTKLDQAARFNDANDPCKVLIATDAIGMGLNLNIRRVIFSTLRKFERNKDTDDIIPSYFAKQIGGRAGRFGLSHSEGVTMALDDENTDILRKLMSADVENIKRAGVCPPFEVFEKFHFLLPDCSFAQLMDIFSSICTVSDHLFNCPPEDIYELALLTEKIPLSLRDRYTFCLSPLKSNRPRLRSFFIKLAQRYSNGLVISYDYLYAALKHLLVAPHNLTGLERLSDAYDCVGAYLWFSYRFPLYFPDMDKVRHLEGVIEELFNEGLQLVTAQAVTSPLHTNLLLGSSEPAP